MKWKCSCFILNGADKCFVLTIPLSEQYRMCFVHIIFTFLYACCASSIRTKKEYHSQFQFSNRAKRMNSHSEQILKKNIRVAQKFSPVFKNEFYNIKRKEKKLNQMKISCWFRSFFKINNFHSSDRLDWIIYKRNLSHEVYVCSV